MRDMFITIVMRYHELSTFIRTLCNRYFEESEISFSADIQQAILTSIQQDDLKLSRERQCYGLAPNGVVGEDVMRRVFGWVNCLIFIH